MIGDRTILTFLTPSSVQFSIILTSNVNIFIEYEHTAGLKMSHH
jgi:hypothetical protein